MNSKLQVVTVSVGVKTLEALDELRAHHAWTRHRVAQIALRVGLEQLARDPSHLLELAAQSERQG